VSEYSLTPHLTQYRSFQRRKVIKNSKNSKNRVAKETEVKKAAGSLKKSDELGPSCQSKWHWKTPACMSLLGYKSGTVSQTLSATWDVTVAAFRHLQTKQFCLHGTSTVGTLGRCTDDVLYKFMLLHWRWQSWWIINSMYDWTWFTRATSCRHHFVELTVNAFKRQLKTFLFDQAF